MAQLARPALPRRPRRRALFEHEYAVDLKPEVWQALSRHVQPCLRNFFRLPLLASVRRTAPEHWSIEHWSKVFDFEGTPVWIAPDFGFWTVEGRLALVDWKTGAADIEATAFQLGCYALYAREMLGVEPARVDLLQVNLREPEVTPLTWDDGRLEEIRQQLRLSIRSMRAYLADADANVARLDGFRADRGAADLPLVQLQAGVSSGAGAAGGRPRSPEVTVDRGGPRDGPHPQPFGASRRSRAAPLVRARLRGPRDAPHPQPFGASRRSRAAPLVRARLRGPEMASHTPQRS